MRDDRGVCFHCGLRNPAGEAIHVRIDGTTREVCCYGCKAVAELIHGAGLERYYEQRTALPGERPPPEETRLHQWAEFDRPEALAELAERQPDGSVVVSVFVDGMVCPACGWLLETALGRLAGVRSVTVNAMTSRLKLHFDARKTGLGALLRHIASLGYRPQPVDDDALAAAQQHADRAAIKRLFVAGIGMMQVMMFAVALYAGAFQDMQEPMRHFLRIVSLLVTTPVVLYSARPFFVAAWRGLKAGRPGMDLPVALAIGAAYTASIAATLLRGEDVYFDSVVMFVFFLSVARFVEARARQRAAARAQALAQLLPTTVTRLVDDTPVQVPLRALQCGDLVLLRAGDSVPADGCVVSGHSEIDEALISGESTTLARGPGDALIAGSVNRAGVLTMRVERVGRETTLAAIGRLLETALQSRPRIAQMADRYARVIVLALLVVAAATAVFWAAYAPDRAFEITLAVLVVTCPCALALATPAALAAATTRLSELGFLITDQAVLETLARADHVVFDKTGTLTTGTPARRSMRLAERTDIPGREQCLRIAAALERHSTHPYAAAFDDIDALPGVSEVHAAAGLGIEGVADGRRWRIGRCDYAAPDAGDIAADADASVIALGDEHGLVAVFELSDALRAEAPAAVRALQAQGLTVHLASGDAAAPVRQAAEVLSMATARSRQTPQDKLDFLRTLQRDGHTVVMVGDGVNDAPVLAGANASVAMAGGTMLARSSAGALLLGGNLLALPQAVALARRTRRIVTQNLLWAALYNIAAVPLAASGQIPPWLAAIGMSASSLVVVLNALRLRRVAPDTAATAAARDRPPSGQPGGANALGNAAP